MISAYLVPGKDGMALFDDLHQRAIAMRLLTNSMESSSYASPFAGYLHYRRALLADKVQLYEIRDLPGNVRGTGQNTQMSSYDRHQAEGRKAGVCGAGVGKMAAERGFLGMFERRRDRLRVVHARRQRCAAPESEPEEGVIAASRLHGVGGVNRDG